MIRSAAAHLWPQTYAVSIIIRTALFRELPIDLIRIPKLRYAIPYRPVELENPQNSALFRNFPSGRRYSHFRNV